MLHREEQAASKLAYLVFNSKCVNIKLEDHEVFWPRYLPYRQQRVRISPGCDWDIIEVHPTPHLTHTREVVAQVCGLHAATVLYSQRV